MANIISYTSRSSAIDAADGPRLNVVSVMVFLGSLLISLLAAFGLQSPIWVVVGVLAGLVGALSPRVAKQWERAVVLRLGRYTGLRGPGLFWVVPLIDSISTYVDQRIITT
ncbi:MAG TPA: SPFH domain-containing protein, partial [Blastocatellia bacterium]|nr:SPFH domain-containing protein [Blastocatellia bacterium]